MKKNNKTKKPIIAALLSLILPGVGQSYNGQKTKGSILIIFTISFGTAVRLASNLEKSDKDIVYWTVMIPIWIYAVVNAYQQAQKINKEVNERKN
ncbi:MAG: hypothetical protein HQ538_05115 [Parcubacteria group bacterium]|nr:hypothetical protein [Parcubacteria group bacterium]